MDGWDRPLVLRIAPPDDPRLHLFYEFRMMRQEPEIHTLVSAKTTTPVPKILAHGIQHPMLQRDFILMERMPGSPTSEQPLTRQAIDAVFAEIGHGLAQVHAITRNEYGYAGAHRPMAPERDWCSAFVVMWNRLLDDIEGCGGYTPADATTLRRLLDKHLTVFKRPVAASLLHMDVWAENILCDAEGRLTGLLDWDRGLWGDPEIEFAVLDYCGISEPAFWEGYGQKRDSSPAAEVRRLFYLLYELQKYIFIRRVRGGSASSGARYRQQALSLASQLG